MADDEIEIEKPVIEAEAPEAAAGVSLDDVISKALDSHEADDAPPAKTDSTRDELGRFKSSKPAAEGGNDAPVADAPVIETADAAKAQPVTAAPQAPAWTDGHFAGWKPEQRDKFKALPPDVQQLVMDRQAENQAFYQRKISETDTFRQAAEPLVQAAQRIEPFARSIGVKPDELLTNYAAIDYQLRYAPYTEKVKLLGQIAEQYGVPFAPPETDPYADPLQPNGQAYPVIHDLQSQVLKLKTELNQYQQQSQQAVDSRIASEIDAFTKATNPDGSPKHPFFETVRQAMGDLISAGKAQSLDAAYQLAAKPILDRIAAEAQARQKAADDAQAAALARAKKAAPVRTSGTSPNGKTRGGGLDAVLDQALAQFPG